MLCCNDSCGLKLGTRKRIPCYIVLVVLEKCFPKRTIYALLTKREVKMTGYWPSSFFLRFIERDEVEVHKNAKKKRGQYLAILT